MRAPIFLFVLALSLGPGAWARDIYISNVGGDDVLDGTAVARMTAARGPVRTLARALQLGRAGDRIVLANTGEPYRESLQLMGSNHSGSPLAPLVIEGNGAVLDGSTPIAAAAWEHYQGDVFRFQPARLGYQQLFLKGLPAVRRPASDSDSALPPLAPLEWCLWRGKIYFRVEAGRLPDGYQPSCCELSIGIRLYYLHDIVLRDLVVQGFQQDGIRVHDVVQRARLERITARGNGRSGISAAGASTVEVVECLIGDNGASQVRNEPFARTVLTRNEIFANTAPAIELRGGSVLVDGKPFSPLAP